MYRKQYLNELYSIPYQAFHAIDIFFLYTSHLIMLTENLMLGPKLWLLHPNGHLHADHLITITLDLLLWTGDGNLSTLLVHHRRSSRTESGTLMKASKLPQFQKELHLSNLHSIQNTGTNPNTKLSRNKITNNFRHMSNGTHFHFQQFHTHWSDLLNFPVSQRNNHVDQIQPKL